MRLATTLALLVALIAACAAPAATPETTTTPAVASQTPEATAEPTAEATAEATAAELELPGDLTLQPFPDSTVTGEVNFSQTADAIVISIENVESDFVVLTGYAAHLLPGACADHSEPAEFDSAIETESFGEGETAELLVTTEDMQSVLATPHSILLTNGAGDLNLACVDIDG